MQVDEGLIVSPVSIRQHAAIERRRRQFRIEIQGAIKVATRGVVACKLCVGETAIVITPRSAVREHQADREGGHCFLIVFELVGGPSVIEIRPQVFRVHFDGRAEMGVGCT